MNKKLPEAFEASTPTEAKDAAAKSLKQKVVSFSAISILVSFYILSSISDSLLSAIDYGPFLYRTYYICIYNSGEKR